MTIDPKSISNTREKKIGDVLLHRQPDLQVYLENIHNPHNASAILRTCDAVGVQYVHFSHQFAQGKNKYHINQSIAMGTNKRMQLNQIDDIEGFFEQKNRENMQIIVTGFSDNAVDFREVDYTKPTLVVMGNEMSGAKQSTIDRADYLVTIPMYGMAQSLNVGVATGILLYEIQRQRANAGMYHTQQLSQHEKETIETEWLQREYNNKKSRI